MKSFFLFVISAVVLIVTATFATINGITFTQNCGGYFERAAVANTVELAIPELERGIRYLEENQLTYGYTSVMYRTPDEDIGFFYRNMVQSLDELKSLKPDATSLERSNVLMKLRETLIINGKEGSSLAIPDGISRYPKNAMYGFLFIGSFVGIVVSVGAFLIKNN